MSERIKITSGKKIPLEANLVCKGDSETFYVRAVISFMNGTELANSPIDLQDLGGGYFYDNSITMKGVDIYATYSIYTDSGYTELSKVYCPVTDIFVPEDENYNEDITGTISNDVIVGQLEGESPIVGQIENNELKYSISSDFITGTMQTENVTAKISEEILIGNLKECDQ